jgi:hypothetical protein
MNRRLSLAALLALAALTAPAAAHDVPDMEHSHAFRQDGYGKYRQGHYYSSPQGSIIIWSPQTYSPYQDSPPVKFARPSPITQPPRSPFVPQRAPSTPVRRGEQQPKRN